MRAGRRQRFYNKRSYYVESGGSYALVGRICTSCDLQVEFCMTKKVGSWFIIAKPILNILLIYVLPLQQANIDNYGLRCSDNMHFSYIKFD